MGWRKNPAPRDPRRVRAYFSDAAGTAAKFLAQPDGPRVGALALDGWDTHFNEGIAQGRLSQLLGSLDAALAAIKSNMGSAWRETVVVARIDASARREPGERAIEPPTFASARLRQAAFQEILAVEMRPLAIGRGARMDDDRLLGCEHAVQVRHRGIKRKKVVKLKRRHFVAQ